MSGNLEKHFDGLIDELDIAEALQKDIYSAAIDIEDTAQATVAMIAARTEIQQIRKWIDEIRRLRSEITAFYAVREAKADESQNIDHVSAGNRVTQSQQLSLGERIRKLRDAHGLSQEIFANKIDEMSYVFQRIETNKTEPTNFVLRKIAKALGVSVETFTSKSFNSPYESEYDDGLGKRMAKIRQERGMNANNLAQKSQVSLKAIEDIEAGYNFPAPSFLARIAKILEVDKSKLLYKSHPGAVEQSSNVDIAEYDSDEISPAPVEKIDTSLPSDLGTRIKKLRNAHGFSRAKLAAQIDTSMNTFYKIELNAESPTNSMLLKIAKALDVSTEILTSPDFESPYERNYDTGLGKRISKIRQEQDMPARQLAYKSGAAVEIITDIENGDNFPAPDFLSRIANVLDVDEGLLYKNHSVTLEPSEKDRDAATQKLLSAVQNANAEEVERIIQEGADVNGADNDGMTSLMYAAGFNSNPKVLSVLINNQANVNSIDKDGMTPLMYAAQVNSIPEMLHILLDNGADINIESFENRKALDYALENDALKDTRACELLREPLLSDCEQEKTNGLLSKPTAVTLFGNKIHADNWENILIKVCEAIILKRPYKAANFVGAPELNLKHTCFSFEESQIEGKSVKLSNGLYASLEGNFDDIYTRCKRILALCGYSDEDFAVELAGKN